MQVTETCDPDTPNLITHVVTTPVTVQDVEMLPPIHTALAKKGLLPAEHLVDAGFADSAVLDQQGHARRRRDPRAPTVPSGPRPTPATTIPSSISASQPPTSMPAG